MSKKDFELIAAVLSAARIEGTTDNFTVDTVARLFASRLGATNARFDGRRFLAACGVTEGGR